MDYYRLLLGFVLLVTGCYCYKFNFELGTYQYTDGDFPTSVEDTLEILATKKGLDEYHAAAESLEKLIDICTGKEWFPQFDNYYERAGLSRADITFIRKKPVTDLLNLMPRYNISDFWKAPFKVLLNRLAFYMKNEGTADTLLILKDVYGSKPIALNKINTFQHNSGYMTVERSKVFNLIQQIQTDETRALTKSFDITDEQLRFLTFDSFVTVNTKFSNLIFQNIHQNEARIKQAYDDVHKILKSLQRYRESIYTWSKTCDSKVPGQILPLFKKQTLDQITDRCFDTTLQKVLKVIYKNELKDSSVPLFSMADNYLLINETCAFWDGCNGGSLHNASVFFKKVAEQINRINMEKLQPYVVIAYSVGLDINANSVHDILQKGHKLDWSVLRRLLAITVAGNTLAQHLNAFQVVVSQLNANNKVSYDEVIWRLVTVNTLIEALNSKVNMTYIKADVTSTVRTLSNNKIGYLQGVFRLSTNDLKTRSLYSLTKAYFGLSKDEFADLYQIKTNQIAFFMNATTADIALLAAPQSDVNVFTITNLISIVQPELKYSNVMLLTLDQLRNGTAFNITLQQSVSQIVDKYTNRVIVTSSFKGYIERWSKSNELARTLDEGKLLDLSNSAHIPTDDSLLKLRLVDFINAYLISFGRVCNPSNRFCEALQICTSTILGYRCACRKGYHFTSKGNCTDLNECAFSDITCDENAICQNTLGSYTCKCKTGYRGDGRTCANENECGGNPCTTDSTCVDTVGSYKCECNGGFVLNGTTNTCTNKNECVTGEHMCHLHATCTDTIGGYVCHCNNGYAGDGKVICDDKNECADTNSPCPEQSFCNNTLGSFTCTCNNQFIFHENNCHQCLPTNKRNCHSNADCKNSKCVCKNGFTGNGSVLCEDINECNVALFDNSKDELCGFGQCQNVIGSYSCICDLGFTFNGNTCVDMDECKVAKRIGKVLCNGENQHCDNRVGTYACITERPNTDLKSGLAVTIPLLIILVLLVYASYYLYRRHRGKKELTSFDHKLNAMYINHSFQDDKDLENHTSEIATESAPADSTPSTSDDKDLSKVKRSGSLNNLFPKRHVRYIFKKEKKSKKAKEKDEANNEEV